MSSPPVIRLAIDVRAGSVLTVLATFASDMSDLFEFKEQAEYPSFTVDGGITYVFVRKSPTQWHIRKLQSRGVTVYIQNLVRGKWTCSCPAGLRGRVCKHATWVASLSEK